PWPIQYVEWLGYALRGDLGNSLRSGLPVMPSIIERLPVTIELTILSFAVGLAVGLPLAIMAAQHRGRATDTLLTAVSLIGISMPGFWLATLLMLALSLWLRLLPSIGFVPFVENPLDNLKHLIMPTIGLGLPLAATIMRFTRSSLLEVYNQDYIRTARAKGL